jgi:hypothetical protein
LISEQQFDHSHASMRMCILGDGSIEVGRTDSSPWGGRF